jgi:hypothetical protein
MLHGIGHQLGCHKGEGISDSFVGGAFVKPTDQQMPARGHPRNFRWNFQHDARAAVPSQRQLGQLGLQRSDNRRIL